VGGATEPERVYARLCHAVNARDWEAVSDCFAEEFHAVDHRVLGWEPMGREGAIDVYRSWAEAVPDMQVAFEWLAGDDDHMAMRFRGHGHAAADMGGGSAEVRLIMVATLRRGRIALGERFDDDDEDAALACLAERQSQAADPSDDASPDEGPAAPT
jgi:hypothetical protein